MMTFRLTLPPFIFEVVTDIGMVADNAKLIYQDAFSDDTSNDEFIDYRLKIIHSSGFRRFYKPQSRFLCDAREPFKPLAAKQAYASLEWGMNWAIASHELQYVIIHSAVLEKNGKAILFPAPPGSGKSTLTAYLANNGWRLLSDEMALIKPNSSEVIPFVRPICLKNESINIAKEWFPHATFSSVAEHTHKGDVIHMAPNENAMAQKHISAEIVAVVFPQFEHRPDLEIYELTMVQTYMQLIENAFNFTSVGKDSFTTLIKVIEESQCFEIKYQDLAEVDAFLNEEIIHAD